MNYYPLTATADITELTSAFEQMMMGIQESAIVLLDSQGNILTWNKGVEKIKGYTAEEIIGQHISIFYLPEDRNSNMAETLLEEARLNESAFYIGRRIRKNGTIFWGRVEVKAIRNEEGTVIGFTKITSHLSSATELGNFWFDNNGIIHIVSSREPHTEEKISEFRTVLKSATLGKPICCVVDIRDAELSHAGNSFAQPSLTQIYKAIAFISGVPTDANTELVINVVPKGIATKVVTSREEGVAWIKKFL